MNPEKILAELDLQELASHYDKAARQLIEVARADGHFDNWRVPNPNWPDSDGLDLTALEQRAQLIAHIHEGIPPRRASRLREAHTRYAETMPAYHDANRSFVRLQSHFVEIEAGDESDFQQLYQQFYLRALSREEPFVIDAGEEALVQWRVAREPGAHARAVAERLPNLEDGDSRLRIYYRDDIFGQEAPLADHLERLAETVVDFLAAGEHLAIRYNTFNNFIWFGISILKVVTDLDLLLGQLAGRPRRSWCNKLQRYVRLEQALLLKFLQAHQEDPAQIRPRDYWYGQEYSYLTRDMIDLAFVLVDRGERLRHRAGREDIQLVEVPPLLRGAQAEVFDEYRHVGRRQTLPKWRRRARLLRWAYLFRNVGRRKRALMEAGLEERELLAQAWKQNCEWGLHSLDIFGIKVSISIDPRFADVAADLDLRRSDRKILFFPTHQSVLDHPVMNYVLQSPELFRAMGWDAPRPCSILARARLTEPAMLRLGRWQFSLIGFTPEEVDRMLVEADGHVILQHATDTGNPARRFARKLEDQPGVIYGAGTTAAFALQCLPIQHALFAQLPPDVVVIPLAFRGIHSLWPKCPRGNLNINPGLVEVFVSPPMPGATTLLPRKRALRTQLEPATLFQAVHIATLLNPEPLQDQSGAGA